MQRTMNPNNQSRDWLSQALSRSDFQARYPGYTYVLSRLEPLLDRGVEIMGVSAGQNGVTLHVNDGFFDQAPHFLVGVLLHEVHHVVLGHITDPTFRGAAFPDLMAAAMEMSANEFIQEPLPGHPVLWEGFQAYGIRARQSTWERYEILATARRAGRLQDLPVDLASAHLETLIAQCPASVVTGHAQRQLEAVLEGLGHDAASGKHVVAGRTPGALQLALCRTNASPPSLGWQAEMARLVMSRQEPGWSYARPNRRFPRRVGEIPGRLWRPSRPQLLVAVDTSGSMPSAALEAFAAEFSVAARYADITVMECDAAIQRVSRFTGKIDALHGRGGTDFRPVFEPDILHAHGADGVVYFTDGEGPWPETEPPVPTLWVLIGNEPFRCPWGRQVRY